MNKNVDEILCELCDLISNSDNKISILSIFQKVFETKNQIELFKRRAMIIEHCERVAKELGHEDDFFEEILQGLCFKNLDYPVDNVIINFKPYKKLVISTFKHYQSIKKEHEVDDIIELCDELKSDIENEDLTEPQKRLMYEICEAVENAKQEHNIVGNSAIKKLQEILMGKLFLYKEEIKNIKSEAIKEKLGKIYKKVDEVNKLMGFALSLKNNTINFLDWIGIIN
jgi:hypothetical protein